MPSKKQIHSDDKATAKPRSSRREAQNFETLTHKVNPPAVIQGDRLYQRALTPQDVLQLQHTIGNQAFSRLLKDQPSVQRAADEEEQLQTKPLVQRQEVSEEADSFNQRPQAKTFAAGPDIFFKRRTYDPASTGGLSRGSETRASARGEPRRVAVSKLQSPVTSPLIVQKDWAVEELVNALRGIDLESFGVRSKTYKLYKVDTLLWKEEKYESIKHWQEGAKPVDVVDHQSKGYHDRKNMEIGVSRDFDAKEAAATIVHEATHAGQYEEAEEEKKAMADLVEREVEAHMKEERFRIQKGIPPKVPGIKRTMVEGREEVDEKSVRQFVEEKYGPKAYYIRRVPRPIGKNFKNKVRQKFSG